MELQTNDLWREEGDADREVVAASRGSLNIHSACHPAHVPHACHPVKLATGVAENRSRIEGKPFGHDRGSASTSRTSTGSLAMIPCTPACTATRA